jgi:hypothetical protein
MVSGPLLFLLLGILLKSLTGIWAFIIPTVGGSVQVIDWFLTLYYSIVKAHIPVSNFSRTPTVRIKKGRHQSGI